MTPDQAQRIARRRKAALRERARHIRVIVASLSATFFVTAFLVVYVQLASGHDPALLATERHATSELASRSTELEGNENPSPSKSSSSSSEASSAEEPTTLTTSQS
ncbi:MAG TPA: hypothetical protein VGG08_10405 [Solirubrobacteraceae bacterium]|jgi:hypothetical protein